MSNNAPNVALTVNVVISDEDRRILFIERGAEPFKGGRVLPGGLVDVGERVEKAAIREVGGQLGVKIRLQRLLGVWSEQARDPHGSCVSIAFHAVIVGGVIISTAEELALHWLLEGQEAPLGFDRARIIADLRKHEAVREFNDTVR